MGSHRFVHVGVTLFRQITRWSVYLALGIWSQPALADTVVTTYVTKVQSERAESRWTLTEWLRIKERMRMMDLWKSLMTDPVANNFRPELNLVYGLSRGQFTQKTADGGEDWTSDVTGYQAKAQLWVSNVISSTIGIRTLNVDLGIEGFRRAASGQVSGRLLAEDQSRSSGNLPLSGTSKGAWQSDHYTGNLRIFGRHTQDSSLILKYGEYHRLHPDLAPEGLATVSSFPSLYSRGATVGAELQLYVFKWLGAEGQYLRSGKSGELFKDSSIGGGYYEYFGFVEISLLRLMLGTYQEVWDDTTSSGAKRRQSETGHMVALKLQF